MSADPRPAAGSAPTYEEVPAFFPAARATLFGVLTRPTGEANGTALTMLTGGGYLTSVHRNRMHVRVARQVASLGYHSLRFDYHGTGESTGTVDRFSLSEPFGDDLEGAVEWLRAQGIRRHVFVGWCWGGYTAMACAPAIADALDGIILSSPPTIGKDYGYYLKEDPAVVRGNFLDPLKQILGLGVPVLVAYGNVETRSQELLRAELAEFLDGPDALVDFHVIDGPLHQLRTLEVQDAMLGLIVRWLTETRPAVRATA